MRGWKEERKTVCVLYALCGIHTYVVVHACTNTTQFFVILKYIIVIFVV